MLVWRKIMIENQLYRENLLEVFRHPKNRGQIKDPDFEARLVNPLCGDEVKIQLKMRNSKTKIIKKAVFSGNGCAISQASASLLASHIEGKQLGEVKKLGSGDVLKLLGIDPTPARLKCALLSLEVLQEAIRKAV